MNNIRQNLSNKIQASGRLNEITYKFKQLSSDELRIVTILRILEMFETTPPQSKSPPKNSKISTEIRNQANQIFITSKSNINKLLESWQLYSKSITKSAKNSPELSLAYANRSAVLLKLHKYEECIDDIDRALKLEYPDHLRGKLLCRKLECLRVLNRSDSMNDTLDEARNWIERTKLSVDERDMFQRKLNETNMTNNCFQSNFMNNEYIPNIISNRLIPSASEALTLCTNDQFGRHVVTTRDVQPGEILVIEKPYSKILSLSEIYTHCSHCLQAHWSMIPCEFCIYAMYCSDECKDKAWEEYHDIECCINGYLVDLDLKKDGLFSMRLAIVALKRADGVEGLRESLRVSGGDNLTKLYRSDDYVNLYNLVTSSESRSISDLFERSLNAAFILYYLCTLTSLFGKKFSSTDIKDIYMDENATFIGGLIMRHMQIIPCNIHSYEEERQMDIVEIGAMALPFCSLINHNCDPNVSRCTTSTRMIIFAILPIKKGSQVYDNYGSHYAVMNREERRDKLKQYYFECNCVPCKNDWPLYENLPSYNELTKDKNVIRMIEKTLEKLDNYVHDAKEDQIDDKICAINELARMIDVVVELVSLPCSEVNNIVETLKRIVTLTYGIKFVIPKI